MCVSTYIHPRIIDRIEVDILGNWSGYLETEGILGNAVLYTCAFFTAITGLHVDDILTDIILQLQSQQKIWSCYLQILNQHHHHLNFCNV
jgi:hypothetical protein